MDKIKSLEILQDCIDSVNSMTMDDIENMKQVYNAEMRDLIDKEDSFEVILPMEINLFFSTGGKLDFGKKCNLDYKTQKYKEASANSLECVAA